MEEEQNRVPKKKGRLKEDTALYYWFRAYTRGIVIICLNGLFLTTSILQNVRLKI
jgi:hypothetical protein